MNKREQAEELNAVARALHDRGQLDEAIEFYRKAAVADPTWAVALFNVGLIFKQRHRWKESLQYNRRATEVDPEYEPAWWNLGIAATALRRWQVARSAWRSFGIDIPALGPWLLLARRPPGRRSSRQEARRRRARRPRATGSPRQSGGSLKMPSGHH